MTERKESPTEMSIDPVRNFTIAFEDRMRAAVIGPPSYSVRKKKIEEAIARYEASLAEALEMLARAGAHDGRIDRKLREVASRFDIEKTNALIDTHNRYYPIEANLPMDPSTSAYLLFGKRWKKEPRISIDSLIANARRTANEEDPRA